MADLYYNIKIVSIIVSRAWLRSILHSMSLLSATYLRHRVLRFKLSYFSPSELSWNKYIYFSNVSMNCSKLLNKSCRYFYNFRSCSSIDSTNNNNNKK